MNFEFVFQVSDHFFRLHGTWHDLRHRTTAFRNYQPVRREIVEKRMNLSPKSR